MRRIMHGYTGKNNIRKKQLLKTYYGGTNYMLHPVKTSTSWIQYQDTYEANNNNWVSPEDAHTVLFTIKSPQKTHSVVYN
jgi:hypothetical protein